MDEQVLFQCNTIKSLLINNEQKPCESITITTSSLKLDDFPAIPFDKITLHAINKDTQTGECFLYCHITGFVKLGSDEDAEFEEVKVIFQNDLELENVFEAMNKGAELVPYVEDTNESDEDEWIYNEEEVRKNTHLHERDEDTDDTSKKTKSK
jgi:hypothetical protein